MATTDPFLHLPVSLARSILSNWLKAKSLSKLDVAYCNHEHRSAFLEILDDSELPGADNTIHTYLHTDIDRLRWMDMRNVKCSTFNINIFDYFSSANKSVVISFIKRAAGCFKNAHITALTGLLNTLLPVIAAERCSFETFTLVIHEEIRDTSQWDASLGQILANSSKVLTDLRVVGSIDWQKHLTGVRLPALRDVFATVSRDSDLVSLCKAAPNITTLNLDDPHCTSAGIAAIGQHCALESLRVACSTNNRSVVDLDVGIAAMAQGCVKLKEITFKKCVNLTDIGLIAIATHCTQLESLSLRECDHFSDEGLAALQSLSATLLSMSLYECADITGSGIVAMARHCKLLHTLVIQDYESNLDPDELVEALPHMHNLTKLVLRYHAIDDEMLQLIAVHMPLLQHLDLGAENDTEDNVDYDPDNLVSLVTKCEKLTYLELPAILRKDVRLTHSLKALRPNLVVSGYSYLDM